MGTDFDSFDLSQHCRDPLSLTRNLQGMDIWLAAALLPTSFVGFRVVAQVRERLREFDGLEHV